MSQVAKTQTNETHGRKFRSFGWKIASLSSLILLAVVLLFCTVSYLGLITNFESQRENEFDRYGRELDSLIARLSTGLRQQAEAIPFLDGMPEALLSNNNTKIKQVFDRHWPLIHFNSGVESVRFYSASSQLIADWSNSLDNNPDDDALIQEWVKQVNHQEKPIHPLLCKKSCIQHTVAPLLIEGKTGGVAVIGITLIDALLAFNRVSGAEIGLLIHDKSQQIENNTYIESWQANIAALTNKSESKQILRATAQRFSDIDTLDKVLQINVQEKYHQIKLYPLQAVGNNQAFLVVITDVTAEIKNIHDSIWKIAAIGFLGLIFSEMLMLGSFQRLLARLKGISYTLPLLADGKFEKFRHALVAAKHEQKYSDEIDMLNVAAVQLSVQLEDLEQKAATRAKLLIEQKDELSKERDFIANLLDTAQVIVLTQNPKGNISSMNAYGEMLTHFSEHELHGTPFLQLLTSDYDYPYLIAHLDEINNDTREQFRHEASIRCKDGTTREIAWLHSRLSGNSENDPTILSVGLDVTEYKHAQERLTWMATHDPLTDLHNRRRFSDELEQILGLSDRYHRPGALLFFDLDRFKYINDTSGHQAGDAFLKLVANMLSQTIRSGDTTARLGGDEFAVILPEINADGAVEVAKKILNNIGDLQIKHGDRTHKVSASVGIALFPEHGDNVHDLLAAADLAMYHAKDTGRNAWHLFSAKDQSRERVQTLVYWKEKIEYAEANDNFILYLQPIMHVPSQQIQHYEVLLRMRDRDVNGTESILPPAGFINAAENTGLIHNIDHLVLRKSIALAAAINRNRIERFISLSINLSAHAFNDPELLTILFHELNQHDIDPALLLFEITETAALENLPGARTLMKEIKELGCGFVLDDFGVGFSSFYYLRELPVDTVKIDGSFIRNLGDSGDDQILVSALCSVASGFGKRITAEYVESEKIFNQIRKMNINYAQGFYVGKPAHYRQFFREVEGL